MSYGNCGMKPRLTPPIIPGASVPMTPRNAARIGHPRLADEDHPGCVYCQDVDPGARGCPHCGRYVPDTDQS